MVDRPPQPPPRPLPRPLRRRPRKRPRSLQPRVKPANDIGSVCRRGAGRAGRWRKPSPSTPVPPGRAVGQRSQFRDGARGRPLPGLPRSGSRGDGRLVAPAGTKSTHRQRSRLGQQDERHRLAECHADRHAGGSSVVAIKTQPLSVKGGTGTGARRWWAARFSARRSARSPAGARARHGSRDWRRGRRRRGGRGRRQGGRHPGAVAAAFTLAVPLQVEIMTNVAVR